MMIPDCPVEAEAVSDEHPFQGEDKAFYLLAQDSRAVLCGDGRRII